MRQTRINQVKKFDITLDKPSVCYARICVDGVNGADNSVIAMRLERTSDGSLDFQVWETANPDDEDSVITNTYPEFFDEVTA